MWNGKDLKLKMFVNNKFYVHAALIDNRQCYMMCVLQRIDSPHPRAYYNNSSRSQSNRLKSNQTET